MVLGGLPVKGEGYKYGELSYKIGAYISGFRVDSAQ